MLFVIVFEIWLNFLIEMIQASGEDIKTAVNNVQQKSLKTFETAYRNKTASSSTQQASTTDGKPVQEAEFE